MSFFVDKDLRWLECADPSPIAAIWRAMRRQMIGLALALCGVLALYFTNVAVAFRENAVVDGTVDGLPVSQNVVIVRDHRGVPHIDAANLHDLFFAQGFAEGSDRLFQMDVTRRYAYGRLAEVFGPKALALDEFTRAVDIAGIAHRQWVAADPATRSALEAFAGGVNAAEQRQPLPIEFRMLLYRPAVWTAQDSIAVSLVAALELSDSWRDVLTRDRAWHDLGVACFNATFPLSDSHYDVTYRGRTWKGVARGNARGCPSVARALSPKQPRIGSNAWAAAASRTVHGHALLANDPHVDLTIPGIWYLLDLRAPGFHAAGAVLPGLPGIVLGHNERIAWGATNADAATTLVYRGVADYAMRKVAEQFHVRFAAVRTKTYYRSDSAFSSDDGTFVRWPIYWQRRSTIATILALDRTQTIGEALQVLASYCGAPENFVLADSGGKIAYQLAGLIPMDAAWGRYVHPSADFSKAFRFVPFPDLPNQRASANGFVVTANNRVYGASYPYRLSAAFDPPYRAYRIASLLHSRPTYDIAFFRAMQLDTYSPVEAEIVKTALRLARNDATGETTASRRLLYGWNGRFDPDSRAASLVHDLSAGLQAQETSLALVMQHLRTQSGTYVEEDEIHGLLAEQRAPQAWGKRGAVEVAHPLSGMWYGMLSGKTLPGDGDEFTIHLQSPGFAQGFRAVWSVGDWDAGGISIPSGESGEPGSPHYDDRALAWIAGTLDPLPFTSSAVSRTAVTRLKLTKSLH